MKNSEKEIIFSQERKLEFYNKQKRMFLRKYNKDGWFICLKYNENYSHWPKQKSQSKL